MPHQSETHVLHRIADLYLSTDNIKLNVVDIARQVNNELNPSPKLTRESVHRLLTLARKQGIVQLVTPTDKKLTEGLEERYSSFRNRITVVKTLCPTDNAKVAFAAAEIAMEVASKIGKYRKENTVGLGLGPGRATLDFCKHFVMLLDKDPMLALRLIAISAGCPANLPEYASSSFFNLFPGDRVREKVGLFAESLVRVKDYGRVKKLPGVHEAFRALDDDVIDIVITSMGDFSDSHDLLRMFLQGAGMSVQEFTKRKWIGNVQYRPFTTNGPVKEELREHRAVTLFELEDLVAMSKLENKCVILMARQCGICGKTRAKALIPLLTNADLKVCNRLVMDSFTAIDLLKS